MANKKNPFVLNDESVTNSYGFRIMNSGIDLERFKANPVMLSDHWNSTANVIGKWENIRIEGTKLLADPVFDENDDDAKKISSKVEGGFLKACSMGIRFNHEFMEEKPDGTYWLNKAELFEVSIVAVPSNANSVRLYSSSGELMDDDQVTLSLKSVKNLIIENQNNTMSKLILSAACVAALSAYGLQNAESLEEVDGAVLKLSAKLNAAEIALKNEKEQHAALKASVKDEKYKAFRELLDQAKLTAEERKDFEELAEVKYELAFRQVEKLVKNKTSLVELSGRKKSPVEGREKWSFAEWQENAPEDLELMYKEDPEKFAELFG